MRYGMLIAILLMGGCTKPDTAAADAEAQYNFVAVNGDKAAKCAEAKKVQEAYLRKKDDLHYKLWKWTASHDCNPDLID